MDPDRREVLRARLEYMKELKAEYYIGSQDAFKYIKAMHYYEQLQIEVRESLGTGTPTLRDIMALNRRLSIMAQLALCLISVQFSTPDDLSISAEHVVRNLTIPEYDKGVPDIWPCHYWRLDMAQLLRALVDASQLAGNFQGEVSLPRSVFGFLSVFKNVPFLIFEATGQRVSLQNVIDNPELRRGTEEGFWLNCESSCSLYEHGEHEEDEDDSLSEDYLRLAEGFARRDIVLCHQIFQQMQMVSCDNEETLWDDERTEKEDNLTRLFHVSKEEEHYLLAGSELFNRAEKEYTLGCLDVERRIAISYIYCFSQGQGYRSIDSLVSAAYKSTLERIHRINNLLKTFETLESAHPIVQHEERSRRYYQYLRLAILQNRRWLIEFLAR